MPFYVSLTILNIQFVRIAYATLYKTSDKIIQKIVIVQKKTVA